MWAATGTLPGKFWKFHIELSTHSPSTLLQMCPGGLRLKSLILYKQHLSLTGEWINRPQSSHSRHYSAGKAINRYTQLHRQTSKCTLPSGRCQPQRATYRIILFRWHSGKGRTTGDGEQLSGCWGWVWGRGWLQRGRTREPGGGRTIPYLDCGGTQLYAFVKTQSGKWKKLVWRGYLLYDSNSLAFVGKATMKTVQSQRLPGPGEERE